MTAFRNYGRGRSAGEAFHHPRFRFGRGHCCFVLGAFHCDTWSCNTGAASNAREAPELKATTAAMATTSPATSLGLDIDLLGSKEFAHGTLFWKLGQRVGLS